MAELRFLSVSSGIECASQAWHRLGWKHVALSEIEPYPCALLHHHYGAGRPRYMPDPNEENIDSKEKSKRRAAIKAVAHLPEHTNSAPNLGDMNQYKKWPDDLAPDLLVGGTPCQSYSVAGLRGGLDDPRGDLMLTYVDIARRYRPRWVAWENVPGVLSSNRGQDFATLLGLLSGQRISVPKEGWQNSGIVPGIAQAYGLAWRVLDAQYFGVPQRRRRVFLIGYLGDYRRAAAVLFERHSLQGNPAPSRKAGQTVAPTIASRPSGGRGLGTDFDLDGGVIQSTPLVMATGQANSEIVKDGEPSLTCNHEQPIVVQEVADALTANWHESNGAKAGNNAGMINPVLAFKMRGGGTTTGARGAEPGQSGGVGYLGDEHTAFTLSTTDDQKVMAPIAYTIHGTPATKGASETDTHAALRARAPGGSEASTSTVVAIGENQRGEVNESQVTRALQTQGGKPGQGYQAIRHNMAVRRLTPRECERLQGYADDYTLIPVKRVNPERLSSPKLNSDGESRYQTIDGEVWQMAADGPRYKAIGNGMAVPVMVWLGVRINAVEERFNAPTP